MERSTDAPEILEQLMCPAFTVSDGMIIHANQAALQRQVPLNAPVADLIRVGAEEYARYTGGRLCLTLCICENTYNASVVATDGYHTFFLESEYEEPELRAFALAAQQLREPLSNAMAGTELLLPHSALQADPEARQQIAQVNRSLHQLLRAVCNMSDAAQYGNLRSTQMETRNVVGILDEIIEKAAHMVSQAGRILQYKSLNQGIYCLVDTEKLERAVLNLISNAAKYTPENGTIEIRLTRSGNRLLFTVENGADSACSRHFADTFSRFLREPGIIDSRSGIGLGMTIARSAAAVHGGTVLMEQPDNTGIRFTMTLAIRQSTDTSVHSPVLLPIDYAGGRDRVLLELSDVLPATLYEENI